MGVFFRLCEFLEGVGGLDVVEVVGRCVDLCDGVVV